MQFPALGSRRAIIDRRAISDRINALALEHRGDPMRLRGLIVQELKDALDHGRADVARRQRATPTRSEEKGGCNVFRIYRICCVRGFTIAWARTVLKQYRYDTLNAAFAAYALGAKGTPYELKRAARTWLAT